MVFYGTVILSSKPKISRQAFFRDDTRKIIGGEKIVVDHPESWQS